MKRLFCTVIVLSLLTLPECLWSSEPGALYAPGEILVQFRRDTTGPVAAATHTIYGATPVRRFEELNIDQVQIPEGWTVEETLALYQSDPDVETAEPNYFRYAAVTPDDEHFNRLWGLHNTAQFGGAEDADMDGPEAWNIQTGSRSVIIAVIDTGADLDHEDLAANIWKNQGEDWVGDTPGNNGTDDDGNGKIDDYFGWDFVNEDNDPDDDSTGHGTHVTGIIGAEGNNGVGITGISWAVSIMPLKILSASGSGLVSDEIAAINYAVAMGASVINASLGGSGNSQLEYNAIRNAMTAGVLFVAAAGNEGKDNDATPVYPAGHDLGNVISVAATDGDDGLAAFSNYGRTSVDVCAPGVLIYSTAPGDTYQYRSGTSMATPYVAGLAGLIWAEYGALSYEEVRNQILDRADTRPGLTDLVATGARINAQSSLEPLLAPSDLSANAVSSSGIDLSWQDRAVEENGFTIERKTGADGTYEEIAQVGADIESYTDAGLSEVTAYVYRVRAYNGSTTSAYSNESEDQTYPTPPQDLAAQVSAGTVLLSWTDNSGGEAGFLVERKPATGGAYTQIATVDANSSSYNDADTGASSTYYYRVGAFSSTKTSYSGETTASLGASSGGGGGGGGGSSCFISAAASGL